MPSRLDVMTIVQHVSHYLCTHPSACDSPEGIAHWWVALDEPAPVVAVEAALDCLTRAGVVEAQQAIDGRVRYRRGPEVPDARLLEIVRDPQSVLPAEGGASADAAPPKGWH